MTLTYSSTALMVDGNTHLPKLAMSAWPSLGGPDGLSHDQVSAMVDLAEERARLLMNGNKWQAGQRPQEHEHERPQHGPQTVVVPDEPRSFDHGRISAASVMKVDNKGRSKKQHRRKTQSYTPPGSPMPDSLWLSDTARPGNPADAQVKEESQFTSESLGPLAYHQQPAFDNHMSLLPNSQHPTDQLLSELARSVQYFPTQPWYRKLNQEDLLSDRVSTSLKTNARNLPPGHDTSSATCRRSMDDTAPIADTLIADVPVIPMAEVLRSISHPIASTTTTRAPQRRIVSRPTVGSKPMMDNKVPSSVRGASQSGSASTSRYLASMPSPVSSDDMSSRDFARQEMHETAMAMSDYVLKAERLDNRFDSTFSTENGEKVESLVRVRVETLMYLDNRKRLRAEDFS